MSRAKTNVSDETVWKGRPWILPDLIEDTILIAVAFIVIYLIGSYIGVTYTLISGISQVVWTGLVLLIFWLLNTTRLLIIRSSSLYVLRPDSLEVRTGVVTSRSFVVSPSGFSDLEVIRTISGRIINSGDIIIRTQSERSGERRMKKVRNPLDVADKIRIVMSRPMVRIEGHEPPDEKQQSK